MEVEKNVWGRSEITLATQNINHMAKLRFDGIALCCGMLLIGSLISSCRSGVETRAVEHASR